MKNNDIGFSYEPPCTADQGNLVMEKYFNRKHISGAKKLMLIYFLQIVVDIH